MGQYQQWLLAQEVDRRLKAEVETLETELFYLQDRITILEQVVPATENVILQALAGYLHTQDDQQQAEKQAQRHEQTQLASHELPKLETPLPPDKSDQETVSYLPRAYSQREMSEDMLAFFDKRSQTDPKLSALLRRERQRASATSENAHTVNEETRRLNENIQRWFARWHRQISDGAQADEVENEQ
jgi:hypothetical protein